MIWLKPGEEVTLNGALISNPHTHKIRLQVNNHVNILRTKDRFDLPTDATTLEQLYHELTRLSGGVDGASVARAIELIEFFEPTAGPDDLMLEQVRHHLADGAFYKAMVACRTALEQAA